VGGPFTRGNSTRHRGKVRGAVSEVELRRGGRKIDEGDMQERSWGKGDSIDRRRSGYRCGDRRGEGPAWGQKKYRSKMEEGLKLRHLGEAR